MKQKLLLFAMLAVFQFSASNAQNKLVHVSTKTNDYGIKYEVYRTEDPFDQSQYKKYILENGDFAWGEEKDDYLEVNTDMCYRFTYTDGVVEKKDDGWVYINLTDGSYFIVGYKVRMFMHFLSERNTVEELAAKGYWYICDKSGPLTECRIMSKIDWNNFIYAKIKVGDNKYEEYKEHPSYNHSRTIVMRIDTISNFYYEWTGNLQKPTQPVVQKVESPIIEKKEISEELKEKSIKERGSKYGLNLMSEIEYFKNEVIPNNRQEYYISYLVANGYGALVGLDGITIKKYKKLNKKNKIDNDAIIKRYAYALDSIQNSWIVTSLHQEVATFPIAPNDTIISYTIEEMEYEDNSTVTTKKKLVPLYKLKYKNGSEVAFYYRYSSGEKTTSVIEKGVNIQHRDVYKTAYYNETDYKPLYATLKKDNGVVNLDKEGRVVLTFDNGDKFFPDNGLDNLRNCYTITGLLSCGSAELINGTLSKADGTVEKVTNGELESVILAKKKAEEERRAKEAAEWEEEHRKALIEQYGQKYAEAALAGELVKGMPADLVDMVFNKIGVKYTDATRWDDGTTRFDLVMPLKQLLGESPYVGRIWFTKDGKLSSWTLYQ